LLPNQYESQKTKHNMLNIKEKGFGTAWLKEKVKVSKKTKENYTCFEGSVEVAPGKFLKLTVYEGQEPKELEDGKIVFPVQVNAWKGEPSKKRTSGRGW
jgi:hypothetical protein